MKFDGLPLYLQQPGLKKGSSYVKNGAMKVLAAECGRGNSECGVEQTDIPYTR
jgi:hypothetical protein